MYSNYGDLFSACRVFKILQEKDIISWNSMIAGYAERSDFMSAITTYLQIQVAGMQPDDFTIFRNCTMSSSEELDTYTLSIDLSICSSISSIRTGKQVHGYILRSGFGSEIPLGNSLITMYVKCGVLEWSSKIFDSMTERNKVSENDMISAYGQHGEGIKAVGCFEAMKELGGALDPDKATFSAVLSSCSHASLVDEGRQIFSLMAEKYCVEPGIEQYSCIIDLLGRAGN
ncbi:hypothetical protein GIB67_022407 [Kingdonia uniflora]|uniref:Pentatricopeptide repeat-containing protein n=1 Tax=Kingdonia uniflora TaxID=39325 RepID=A0A7J7MU28_9MAGN|nr:hypothetical protein GIB67_022407 [Kingdonia uniflora]